MILEAKNIYKSFGENLEILSGLDFQLKTGEVACIMGESGSGKTTLLQILGTLDNSNSGSIILNGENVSQLKGNALSKFRNKNIGFLFQHHYLLADFNALENVMMPALIGNLKKSELLERAEYLLGRVGLTNRIKHYPSELSGGERQRIAIVRAIINNPSIVFADEPSGSLDEKNSDILMELIFELGKELNQTFLIATHSNKLADKCDSIYNLVSGKLEKVK